MGLASTLHDGCRLPSEFWGSCHVLASTHFPILESTSKACSVQPHKEGQRKVPLFPQFLCLFLLLSCCSIGINSLAFQNLLCDSIIFSQVCPTCFDDFEDIVELFIVVHRHDIFLLLKEIELSLGKVY